MPGGVTRTAVRLLSPVALLLDLVEGSRAVSSAMLAGFVQSGLMGSASPGTMTLTAAYLRNVYALPGKKRQDKKKTKKTKKKVGK